LGFWGGCGWKKHGSGLIRTAMVLAILHNVIIGLTVRLDACISVEKGSTIMPHYVTQLPTFLILA